MPASLPACLPTPPLFCLSPAGRLEDKSSLVRKEALRLLQALMLHNPFGPKLPLDRFDKTLADHRAMLDQLVPPEEAAPALGQEGDTLQQPIRVEGGAEGGAAAEEPGAAVKAEPGAEETAEEMEVDGEAAAAVAAEQDEAAAGGEAAEEEPAQPTCSRELGARVACAISALSSFPASQHCPALH